MSLILISWIYTLFTSINFGNLFLRILKHKPTNGIITSILGLFLTTILASIWACFERINIEFHALLLILNGILFIQSKKQITNIYKSLYEDFKLFSKTLKWIFFFCFIIVLIQSSTSPILPDNETYYIQTIKWLNEYGFVPGLANLHLFLGQTSGWHITQSVFNFSFLYSNFNDLNGLCLVLVSFYFLKKLQLYSESKSIIDLLFGLFPMLYVVLYPFVNSPSPDLMVYLLSFIIFYLFLKNATSNYLLIVVFALFAFYIKITSAILLMLPILLITFRYPVIKTKVFKSISLSIIVVFLWIIKNIIITGYPFFPVSKITFFKVSYAIPEQIIDYFFSSKIMHSFYVSPYDFNQISSSELLKKYFFNNGVDSVFAIITLMLVIIIPFVFYRIKNNKLWIIYGLFITQLTMLSFSSPQFRFYFFFTLFFSVLLLAYLLKNNKLLLPFYFGILFFTTIIYFFPNPLNLNSKDYITFTNLVYPKLNSSTNCNFKKVTLDNLNYNSPSNTTLFWITGNGLLPCVSQDQIDYFQANFNVIPQMNGTSLKDGFYSKELP
ncbi:LIC_10190 family membrane protein [Flavobacterium capsici]|uniref:DUF8201 domain-containing protein n=1 Tax=Flavobacterium capsici TaxID=3075618 RepID=A0AA96J897_9FLAO|nr:MULTISPECIES: hypothetical protein [unclassified Flavobacterium]WNM18104.1 hypothetical protein RN608_08770 [Flavobacterium sp. PMR2A8]WNM22156.1 hypothetical protein RN605_02070 [Flavobacterium sp. PMTSA4]